MTGSDPEWAARRPAPALRPFVDSYVGYRQHDVSLAVHRGLPSRHMTLIISLAEPIRMLSGPGTERGPLSLQTVVGGLHLAPALISQDRHQHGIHVELNPLGMQALLGVAASELTSTAVAFDDLPVPWARELAPRLVELPDWPSRFDLLDRLLASALRPVTLVSEISWAWRRMRSGDPVPQVAKLAEEVGWSRRHFSDRFARAVGVSPKQAARLIRFERSRAMLSTGRYANHAEVAVRCGYYDQAHLVGEWRALAGCSPGVWMREELPFLQYSGDDQLADSDA